MKLGELFESGIVIEGYRKIQCYEQDNVPTVYYEGENQGDIEHLYDREISYLFSISENSPSGLYTSGICIELKEP